MNTIRTTTLVLSTALLVMVGSIFYSHTISKNSFPREVVVKEKEKVSEPKIEFDFALAKNASGIHEAFDSTMDTYRLYQLNWVNITKIEIDGEDAYFGEIENLYGNGKIEPYRTPLFFMRGNFYTPLGYGGIAYEPNETHWVTRYRRLEITDYMPIERYATAFDKEDAEISKRMLGVQNISIDLDKTGKAHHIEIVSSTGTKSFDGPFKEVKSFNLITRNEFKNSDDYITHLEQFRSLPGNVSEEKNIQETMMGYFIKYPAMINGKKVVVLNEQPYYYTFNVEDKASNIDLGYLYCSENNSTQIGPKIGKYMPISKPDVLKLIDWGFLKEYQGEVFTFTGPGFYCTLRTSGIFRPDMFEISFSGF
jgi:hypothetical protein